MRDLTTLDARIDAELLACSDPEPASVAARLVLTRRERMALFSWALVLRTEERIRVRRHSFRKVDVREPLLGVAAERSSISEKQKMSYLREDREANDRLSEKLGQIVQTFADEKRAEGIRIGLDQANTERVRVAGEWMLLGDCTSAHLRVLGVEYEERAGSNLRRGSYYWALADQMDADGHMTVRSMCEEQT